MLQYADSYSPSYLIEHLDSIMKQFYPKAYDFSNLTEEEQNNLYINVAKEIKTFIEEHKNDTVDSSVDELLDDVAYQIMKISVREDLNNELE